MSVGSELALEWHFAAILIGFCIGMWLFYDGVPAIRGWWRRLRNRK